MYHKHNNFQSFFMNKTSLISKTKEIKKNPIVLILNYGDEFSIISNNIVTKLRENEINSEYFPDKIKIKKQLTYANKKNIRFILFYGKEEMESSTLILRDMKRNIQKKKTFLYFVALW